MKCIWENCEEEAIGEEEAESITMKLEGVDFSKICKHHCTQLENILELGSKSDVEKACALAKGEKESEIQKADFLSSQEALKKLFEMFKDIGNDEEEDDLLEFKSKE